MHVAVPAWTLHRGDGVPATATLSSATDTDRASLPHLRLSRLFRCRGFQAAVGMFNALAEVADAEGHHPDLALRHYRYVLIDLETHAAGGLTENDFILAARIDGMDFSAFLPNKGSKPQPINLEIEGLQR